MAGTLAGGLKAAKTNKERHGKTFYAKIGQKGGQVTGIAKGFGANKKLASEAGKVGGKISKRGKKL